MSPRWPCLSTARSGWLRLAPGRRLARPKEAKAKAAAAAQAEQAAYNAFLEKVTEQSKTDAKGALAAAQKFLQANDGKYEDLWLYTTIAEIQSRKLNDLPDALATIDEGLRTLFVGRYRLGLLILRVDLLNENHRGAESIPFMQDQWAQAATNFQVRAYTLPLYVKVLEANGKSDEALAICRKAVEEHLEDTNQLWLFQQYTKELLLHGQEDEALSWAKLHFMNCSFDDYSITGATKLISDVWMAKSLNAVNGNAFIKAQQDEGAPNPLQAIALPAMDADALRVQLEALLPTATQQRITMMLNRGDLRGAMLRARALLLEDSSSNNGVLEICRVFKAADLNLRRANAFLQYYKTGEGVNPVDAFLKEHPAGAAPAAAAPVPAVAPAKAN